MKAPKVNRPDKIPFHSVEDLGVAMRTIGDDGQLHMGLLYRPDAMPSLLLHLRTHFDLRNEEPTAEYRWLQVDLDELNRRAIVGLCELIATSQSKVPYGFSYNGQYFEPTGNFIEPGFGNGLTCATFVMAVFRTVKIEILKTEEWTTRPEDITWQRALTAHLRKEWGPFLADGVEKHIGDPRFRPDEVAAGATIDARPLSLEDASNMGQAIRRQLAKG